MRALTKTKLEIDARQLALKIIGDNDEGVQCLIFFSEELTKVVEDIKSTAKENYSSTLGLH